MDILLFPTEALLSYRSTCLFLAWELDAERLGDPRSGLAFLSFHLSTCPENAVHDLSHR
jgi:hypothetical protein